MYDSMDRSAVRALKKRGRTLQEIAQELGMDRRTVNSVMESPIERTYQRERTPSKTDRFQQSILDWADDGVPIQRMLELAREGENPYDGSRSAFFSRAKLFIAEHRKAKAERFVRFEGMPGEYCQVDWGEVRNFPFLRATGETRYFLACRLKFSRKSFVVFTRDMKLETLIRCMLLAFAAFGGVSWVCVFDNMKTVTLGRDAEGRPIWNPTFFRFSQDLDFHPEVCAPASGNQKGAVENLVGWVKSSFLPGRKFLDDDDLATQTTTWLVEKANGSVSQAHGEIPEEVFLAEERRRLTPLTTSAAEYGLFLPVLSGPESLIHIDSNRYSIPVGYAETPLTARLRRDAIDFYSADKLVAHWVRHHGKRFRPFINPEHFDPVFDKKPRARVMLYRDHLVEQDASVGAYIAELCRRHRGAFGPDIIALYDHWKEYGTEELGVACALASEHGAYGAEYVLALLQRPRMQPLHNLVVVQGAPRQEDLDRELSEYERFVEGGPGHGQ